NPGWPDFACSTASMARARMAFAMRSCSARVIIWFLVQFKGGGGIRGHGRGRRRSPPQALPRTRARVRARDRDSILLRLWRKLVAVQVRLWRVSRLRKHPHSAAAD